MEGGEAVFDSRVIVEYLDTLSPVGRLIPATGRERVEVRTWEALADGLLDASIAARLEQTWPGRSEAQRSAAWIDRHMHKVHAALKAMSQGLGERPWCSGIHMTPGRHRGRLCPRLHGLALPADRVAAGLPQPCAPAGQAHAAPELRRHGATHALCRPGPSVGPPQGRALIELELHVGRAHLGGHDMRGHAQALGNLVDDEALRHQPDCYEARSPVVEGSAATIAR